jgi:hypothetical protein
MSTTTEARIADDIIRGAKGIADETGLTPAQVYHAHRAKLLPIFSVGAILHVSRRRLREHYEGLEAKQRKEA